MWQKHYCAKISSFILVSGLGSLPHPSYAEEATFSASKAATTHTLSASEHPTPALEAPTASPGTSLTDLATLQATSAQELATPSPQEFPSQVYPGAFPTERLGSFDTEEIPVAVATPENVAGTPAIAFPVVTPWKSLDAIRPYSQSPLGPLLPFSSLRNSVETTVDFQSAPFIADEPLDPAVAEAGLLWNPGRVDSHAPIGVMGEHTHSKGEVMLSYRYMRMHMSGNRDGTNNLTPAEVLQDFPVTPTRMTTEMHMFGAMYAPSDNITLMAMAPYVIKSMDHVTRMGVNFTTRSEGFGDIKLGGLFKIFDRDRQRIHINGGFSLPTGSISERDNTPAGPDQVLPYPMQTGSGTVDFMPGITYLGQAGNWSWGAQGIGTIRLGRNVQSYRLGNQLNLTGWGARRWTNWLSTSIRLRGRVLGNISGADPRLNPAIVPTADPDLRGGSRIDLSFGINLLGQKGFLKGHRLAIEAGFPIYQSLAGPQLESDYTITIGWQKAFKP